MTLAVILLVSISCTASARIPVANARQTSEQSAPASAPATGTQTPENGSAAQNPSTATKPASPAPAPSGQKPKTAHPRQWKKKVTASDCVTAPNAGAGPAIAGSGTTNSAPNTDNQPPPGDQGAATTTAPATPAPKAPTICPPAKVIVRQGGTAEPSIHLAGGVGGDQAAQQRHTANQYLGATETNLKKLAGQQLTANQQDMLKQIHQFMDQSKSAVAAGDLERGRTLAWKAQLLSEELVNPQK